jgi:hypothetical protein
MAPPQPLCRAFKPQKPTSYRTPGHHAGRVPQLRALKLSGPVPIVSAKRIGHNPILAWIDQTYFVFERDLR